MTCVTNEDTGEPGFGPTFVWTEEGPSTQQFAVGQICRGSDLSGRGGNWVVFA
jgi:hypothetical protein